MACGFHLGTSLHSQVHRRQFDAPALKLFLTHTGDNRWQEVFLLLASMHPDATAFLVAYERALQALAAQNRALHRYLRRAGELAQSSKIGYRQTALCALLIAADTASFHDHDRAHSIDRKHADDIYFDAIDLAHDLDHPHERAYALALVGLALRLDHSIVHYYFNAVTMTADHSVALDLVIARILDRDRDRLEQLRVLSRDLDIEVLASYLQACSLFHECLELAYTPDKSGFEDRMLLPPPGFTPPGE